MGNMNCAEQEDKIRKYEVLCQEASFIREQDKSLIRDIFEKNLHMSMEIGIGFQRSYGSILSGDYFSFFRLPDGGSIFIFLDICGHGLPAYTTLIRFRSATILALNEFEKSCLAGENPEYSSIIHSIAMSFTKIMDFSGANDFASVNFVFFRELENSISMEFYNRSMLFPIVFRPNGKTMTIIDLNEPVESMGWKVEKGFLLGRDILSIVGESDYLRTPKCSFELHKGDMIFFYTDGLTEAFNSTRGGEEFGQERLIQSIMEMIGLPPQLIINNVFERIYSYIGGHEEQRDDMTAILLDFSAASSLIHGS